MVKLFKTSLILMIHNEIFIDASDMLAFQVLLQNSVEGDEIVNWEYRWTEINLAGYDEWQSFAGVVGS